VRARTTRWKPTAYIWEVGLEVQPFHLDVADEQLVDLRARLLKTRWPEAETVDDWSQGIPLAYVKDVCHYWATSYDWRRAERRLNELPQFRTTIDGLDLHFLHVRSPHPNALPLVMTHGWPGSVVEFLKVIGPLTDPVAHGGEPADAFDVICPSLPGFGFSGKPTATGWGVERIGSAWTQLMAGLGYERYGAQGGDWGASVTAEIGLQDPAHVAGIHLNMPFVSPSAMDMSDLTEEEMAVLVSLGHYQQFESGYSKEQSTRPQTVGYSLVDSPAGLCSWILEKFCAWTDCDGHPENVLARDELLDNVMLYWLPAAGASSARIYWESFNEVSTELIGVPTGCSIFPKEILRISRRWASSRFTNILYWNELDKGGHFAAFEQPALFVEEVRSFFQMVR
jgi:pimeloyl-ACP methyl ester carboxylesterase